MCSFKIQNDKVHRVDRRMDVKQSTHVESILGGVHVMCLLRRNLIYRSAFVLPDGLVNVSSSLRNLGTYFDESMSMTEHVNRLVRSCFNQLRRIRFILSNDHCCNTPREFLRYCQSLLL